MARVEHKRRMLREGLTGSGVVATVGAHDAMTARLIDAHGFDAVWVSGLGVSTMTHAIPDTNLVTMAEALAAAVRIDHATSLPVVADCDNGFGGLGNVVRTVREYERAGIAGICVEDNVFPKRNSLLDSSVKRELVTVDEQASRLAAGVAERDDEAFTLIARVEALIAGHGVDEACRRADAYVEAGADAILIHSRDKSLAEIEAFLDRWEAAGTVPLVAVPTLFPSYTAEALSAMGFRMVIFANQPMRAAISAIEDTLRVLASHRRADAVDGDIAPLDHVFDLVGTREAIEAEDAARRRRGAGDS
ncbi:phosphonopyruvate hydrolase [soil metagenome]